MDTNTRRIIAEESSKATAKRTMLAAFSGWLHFETYEDEPEDTGSVLRRFISFLETEEGSSLADMAIQRFINLESRA